MKPRADRAIVRRPLAPAGPPRHTWVINATRTAGVAVAGLVLAGAARRLRYTVKNLNRRLRGRNQRFREDGARVWWAGARSHT
jgi:hypothetical protein